MKRISPLLSFALVVFASGCATTNFTPDGTGVGVGKIRKPGRIIVYPFAATTADLGPGENGNYAPSSATAEQVRVGREIGVEVAHRLAERISEMGIPSVVGTGGTQPNPGDLVIRGHFESIDEGSAAGRIAIGFGSGSAELRTVVAAYRQTTVGLQRVGGGSLDSEGGKGPGLFVPIIVTAATANPVGLIVAGAAKIEGEASGRTTIEGAAKRTADAIADRCEERFEKEGWID